MSDLENFDIRASIIDSVIDTFDTMVSMEVESSFSDAPSSVGISRMVATVNFAGIAAGIFNIQVTSEFARLMTANMLDMEPEEVESEDEIRDLLAEIANIVGGNLKSALNDAGHRCVLSTPSITYGADFTIKSLNMERFERFVFKYQENFIVVEVGLKIQQGSEDGDGIGSLDKLGQINNIDFEKINEMDLNVQVTESLVDVFDTMLSLKLEKVDETGSDALEGIRNVGSVSFAGDVAGMFSIHVGEEFSRKMAAEMLGMEVEEIEGDDEIRDLLGEIGNIVGGNLKSAFTDAGLTCALSTPSFTTGSDFKIETLNMEKYERFAFRCDENIVYAEMGIKISEFVQPIEQPVNDIHSAGSDDAVAEDTAAAPQEEKAAAAKAASSPEEKEDAQTVAMPPENQAKTAQQPGISTPPASKKENDSTGDQDSQSLEDVDLSLLLDIPLEIKVELGRAKIPIRELRNLAPGSAVKLLKLEGEPVDILANDTLIARGEVVVQNEKYGIRVIEITSRMERIRSFGL
jgi:flagellar motor switch protein FliN/FliY